METLAKISKLLDVGVEDLYDKQFMESVCSKQSDKLQH